MRQKRTKVSFCVLWCKFTAQTHVSSTCAPTERHTHHTQFVIFIFLSEVLPLSTDLFMFSRFQFCLSLCSHRYFLYTLSHTIMHSEHPPFHLGSFGLLPFCLSISSSLWYFDRSICSSVKNPSSPIDSWRFKKKEKKNFVKGACWENSSLPAAVDILDLDWWVSTLRNRKDTGSLHSPGCPCVCFWGVSLCRCVCKHVPGGWKAVSNNAKMPGTGDYWSPSRPLSPTTINEGELSFYQPGLTNTMHLCYL